MSKKLVVVLTLLFIACSRNVNAEERCGNRRKNVITLDNCDSRLVKADATYFLKITCHRTKKDAFGKWNGTNHDMQMTTTFHTTEINNNNNSGLSTTSCLKLFRIRITYKLLSRLYELPKVILFTDHQLAPKSSLGKIDYDGNCVRKMSSSGDFNVSRCVRRVQAFDFTATTVDFNGSVYFKDPAEYVNSAILTELNETVLGFGLRILEFSFERLHLQLLSSLKIQTLNFSDNGIFKIGNGDFPFTDTLEVLNLDNCNVESIEDEAFQSTPNLKRLNLAGNSLKTFPTAVSALTNLLHLNLSANGGKTFYSRSIDGFQIRSRSLSLLHNLSSLDLSDMRMFTLTAFQMVLFNLKYVNLANSHTVMEPDGYDFPVSVVFPNVETLVLSNCEPDASRIFAEEYPHLRALDLSENQFPYRTELDALFNRFPNLRRLSLANNRIDRPLSIQLINDTRTDLFLDLSGNDISSSWKESKIKVDETRVKLTLDLSKNKISTVNLEMLRDFSTAIKDVNLYDNPFDCTTCVVDQFYDWLQKSTANTSSYRCAYPKELEGKLISALTIDREACLVKYFNWLLNVSLPLSLIAASIVAIVVLVFKYKWYLRYFYHLFRARMANARKRRMEEEEGMARVHKFDAFVSYCSAECDWVVRFLIPHLEREEPVVHLCVHERDFEIGETIINNVIECIDNSRKSIFLISKMFIRSNWCQWELQMAQHKLFDDGSDVLVLVLLEEIDEEEIPKSLKRLMSTRTYLVWPAEDNVPARRLFWARLKQSVGKCRCLQSFNADN